MRYNRDYKKQGTQLLKLSILLAGLSFGLRAKERGSLSGGTCADMIENKTGEVTENPWTSMNTSVYSVVEQLVGHEIDFYNIQFYNQTYTDYSNSREMFIDSKSGVGAANPYISICELNQMAHLPLDKIVWGTCTCDGCGSTWISQKICKGEDFGTMWLPDYEVYFSPDQLTEMFVEGGLTEQIGGIMSWKLDVLEPTNNALEFRKIMDGANGKSAFFSDKTAPTRDIPRYSLYLNKWLNYVEDWDEYLKAASENGVNYINLAFFTDAAGPLDASMAWRDMGVEGQLELRKRYPQIKMLVSLGGDSRHAQDIPDAIDPKVFIDNIVSFAKENNLDGVDFDLEGFDSSHAEIVICLASYMTHYLRSIWKDAIITHAPQSPHFGPLFEDVTNEKRDKVLSMFDNHEFAGCYDHLRDGHRNPIPKPDPSNYRRPEYGDNNPLPLGYYDLMQGETLSFTTGGQTETGTQTEECIC